MPGNTFLMCEMDNILQADKHPFAAQADIHHQPPKAAASLISYGP
jgi:hypothetical protein